VRGVSVVKDDYYKTLTPLDFSPWFVRKGKEDTFIPHDWNLPFPWISMFVYTHMKATFPNYNGFEEPKPKVLQVGCAQGGDAVEIAKVLKLPMINGELHVVDWFKGNLTVDEEEEWYYREENAPIWREHLWNEAKKFEVDDIITVFEGDSREVLPTLEDEYYDMVFIDGGHEYNIVKSDIEHGYKKLKKGGIIVLDDFSGGYGVYDKYDIGNLDNSLLERDTHTFDDGHNIHVGVIKATHEFLKGDYIVIPSHDKVYHIKR